MVNFFVLITMVSTSCSLDIMFAYHYTFSSCVLSASSLSSLKEEGSKDMIVCCDKCQMCLYL